MRDHHMEDTEDTISLSGLQFEDENILNSSNSSSSFEQDFLGFFSEEWSNCDPSYPENIIFCGKILSSEKPSIVRSEPLTRSTSDSSRFKKTTSLQRTTPRSKSLPNRLPPSLSCKSKWQMFMLGFGSGNFSTTMDMSDIKSRQLRRQRTVKVDYGGGRRSVKAGWWRLVEVLGCNGGYETDTMVAI